MFPFERYMVDLKKYVCNHSRLEGCITKGYGIVEVIEFCVDFIDDLNPIRVPMSCHEGRLKGKGTLAKKSNMHIPDNGIRKANFMFLQNSSLMAPYMEEHMNILRSENPGKSKTWIARHHIDTFAVWLRRKFMGDSMIDEQFQWLAREPSITIMQYQGYEINGYTFYTRARTKIVVRV
jgi:hypothetical protein